MASPPALAGSESDTPKTVPAAGERQHVNHLALPVDTSEEFDAAYQRLKHHGVAMTEIIERGMARPSTSTIRTASACKLN